MTQTPRRIVVEGVGVTLGEVLGRGAMGTVVRGRLDDGTGVAVKLVTRPLDERGARRFARELDALRRLRHPNVVGIIAGSEGPPPSLVLELVEGEDLSRRLARGRLGPGTAAAIVGDVALGIAHAHANGLIHRDVKPANVLVHPDGRALLTDFGVAKHLDASVLTDAGAQVGTYLYMAPEHFGGEVGRASDVWALGVVLYEALTGVHPFARATTVVQLLEALQSASVVAPRRHDPTIPEELEALCLACLAKDPGARPSAEEVARQLKPFASDLVLPRAGAVPRSRAPLLFGLAAALALTGFGVGRLLPLRGGPAPTPAASSLPAANAPREAAARVAREVEARRAPAVEDVLLFLGANPSPALADRLVGLLPGYELAAVSSLVAAGPGGRALAASSLAAAGRLDGPEPNALALVRKRDGEPLVVARLRRFLEAARDLRDLFAGLDWERLQIELLRKDAGGPRVQEQLARAFEVYRTAAAALRPPAPEDAPCFEGPRREVARALLRAKLLEFVARREHALALATALAPFAAEGGGWLGALHFYVEGYTLGRETAFRAAEAGREVSEGQLENLERVARELEGEAPLVAANLGLRALELRTFLTLARRRAWHESVLAIPSPATRVEQLLLLTEAGEDAQRAAAIAAVDLGIQVEIVRLEARARLHAGQPDGVEAARKRLEWARRALTFAQGPLWPEVRRGAVPFWAFQVHLATLDAAGPAALDPALGEVSGPFWNAIQALQAVEQDAPDDARRYLALVPEDWDSDSFRVLRILVPRPGQDAAAYTRGVAELEREITSSAPVRLSPWFRHSTWFESLVRARARPR